MMDFREFIEQTLRDAAAVASKNFGKVSGVVKDTDNNQVLTDADIETGNLIVGRDTMA